MKDATASPALVLTRLNKRFGNTQVISDLNLLVQPGERVGIIGPNGAGKSTLFDLISGRCAPSNGQIHLHGQRIDGKKPFEINRLGLARSFQITNIFGQLSVWDNLRCAALWGLGYRYTLFKWLAGLDDLNTHTEGILGLVRLEKQRDTLAAHLTYAQQRTLDLGITLACKASIILLDEPSSGMSRSEAGVFTALIEEATQGKTLLVVEHDMSVLFGLVDKIAVLVQGELLAFDSVEAVQSNPAVQAAYLGETDGR